MNEIAIKFNKTRRWGDLNIMPKFLVRFIVLGALIAWCTVTFWLFYPYVVLEVLKDGEGITEPGSEIQIVNNKASIHPGDYLFYSYEINKKKPLQAIISKQLLNSLVIIYTQGRSNLDVGGHTIRDAVKIPEYAEEGEYQLRIEHSYKVNPMRDVSVVVRSAPFYIKAKR